MTDRLRVGILGFGFIGTLHARAVTNCPDTELAGAWTLPDKSLDNFRSAYPQARVFSTAEELIASPDVDVVVIGLPNKLHHPMAMASLKAGKHVLVEKPMAMNVSQAEAMGDLARKLGLTLMAGHMWRFDREFQAVRTIVESGDLGTIVKTKGYGIHQNWGPSGWFVQKELAGGGALVDMGVHALDSVRFLLGDPMPVSVYATIGTHFGNYDVDDTGLLVVRWDNGATSTIESGWWHPHMDGPEASTQLFGTRGYARVFPTMAKFNEEGKAPWLPRFPVREDHCDQHIYDGQMQELAMAIRERRESIPGADHGLVVMRICEAAYRSAEINEVVRLC